MAQNESELRQFLIIFHMNVRFLRKFRDLEGGLTYEALRSHRNL